MCWSMSDDPQGNQHSPLVDPLGRMDLLVAVFDDNAPHIVGDGTGNRSAFARRSDGIRKFFYAPIDSARAAMIVGDWTIEINFRIEAIPTGGARVSFFEFRGFGESSATNDLLSLGVEDDGSLAVRWERGEGTNVAVFFPTAVVETTNWHVVQMRGVVSGSDRIVYMYLDGVSHGSQTALKADGGANSFFSLFGRIVSVGGGTADLIITGAIGSFHIISEDIGESAVLARSSLTKFTQVANSWTLHNFTETPSQRDESGKLPGMNPAPFTDVSSVQPERAERIVCDNGVSKSFTASNAHLMVSNNDELRALFQNDFTFEFWIRPIIGSTATMGICGNDPDTSAESKNNQFTMYLSRVASAWKCRFTYSYGAVPTHVDVTGSIDILDESENGAKSYRWPHLISVVRENVAGTLNFHCYLDGVFVETVVASSPPTGGQTSNWYKIGTAGTNTPANASLDWVRFSTVKRTSEELLETFTRGQAICGVTADPVPPEITVISPSAGTSIQPGTTLIVEVTDNIEIALSPLYAEFPGWPNAEMIYDGANFLSPYAALSTVVDLGDGGRRFSLRRSGGWPGDVSITFLPTDTTGNQAS